MKDREIFFHLIKESTNEMNHIIDQLYITSNSCTKNILLNQLRKKTSNFSMLLQGLEQQESNHAVTQNLGRNDENDTGATENIKLFTKTELAKYNGKNGYPAYVAVNGIVYDVTNQATWAGASHFGLSAGRDVSNEFASCHSGQPILSKLKVVGKMIG